MSEVPISWFLTLSAVLFVLGVAGFCSGATSSPYSCPSS